MKCQLQIGKFAALALLFILSLEVAQTAPLQPDHAKPDELAQQEPMPYDRLLALDLRLYKFLIDQKSDIEVEPIPPAVRQLGQAGINLYVISIFDAEVANGDFDQFFENSSGALAIYVRDAFQQMDMSEFAEIMTRSIEAFGAPYPIDMVLRRERMEVDSKVRHALALGNKQIDVWSREFIEPRYLYAIRTGFLPSGR